MKVCHPYFCLIQDGTPVFAEALEIIWPDTEKLSFSIIDFLVFPGLFLNSLISDEMDTLLLKYLRNNYPCILISN